MAREEDVRILRRGIAAWNEWRAITGALYLDLSGIDLTDQTFPYMARSPDDPYDGYLQRINLWRTNLSGSRLADLCITDADLRYANLRGAVLRGTRFVRVKFRGAELTGADLRDVDVVNCELDGVDMPLELGEMCGAAR
jgi:uncharacterized protein YjbI with pentapeptide repeats